jgi:hypothetical protein
MVLLTRCTAVASNSADEGRSIMFDLLHAGLENTQVCLHLVFKAQGMD